MTRTLFQLCPLAAASHTHVVSTTMVNLTIKIIFIPVGTFTVTKLSK